MKHARPDYDRIQDPRPEDKGGIPENEPVFLLRATDKCAPLAVMAWAMEAKRAGADEIIVMSAIVQAQKMIEYQVNNGSKIPDMPY